LKPLVDEFARLFETLSIMASATSAPAAEEYNPRIKRKSPPHTGMSPLPGDYETVNQSGPVAAPTVRG
jgi:hypothetical protein